MGLRVQGLGFRVEDLNLFGGHGEGFNLFEEVGLHLLVLALARLEEDFSAMARHELRKKTGVTGLGPV